VLNVNSNNRLSCSLKSAIKSNIRVLSNSGIYTRTLSGTRSRIPTPRQMRATQPPDFPYCRQYLWDKLNYTTTTIITTTITRNSCIQLSMRDGWTRAKR